LKKNVKFDFDSNFLKFLKTEKMEISSKKKEASKAPQMQK